MTSDKTDFTQGNILKKLVPFMIPILGALVLQAAYGAVDLLVVGRFGSTSGLSAVSTGSQVLNLVTFVVTQLAMGVTVLIARYLGEKNPEQIGSVIGGAAVVFTLLSVCLFAGMVFFARPISVLMQAPAEAVTLTTSYVRICGSGIFFIVAYNLLSAIFRGLGDSKSPLLFVLVSSTSSATSFWLPVCTWTQRAQHLQPYLHRRSASSLRWLFFSKSNCPSTLVKAILASIPSAANF